MAKKNNAQGTTSVITNSFIKGMNKDVTQSMEPAQSWWNARNAANNSNEGDIGVIGNEPSNLQCGVIPYTVIGAIHRFGDEWIVYSTDNISSEIGRFDDSECKYTTLVNDPCLAFNTKFLITGAAKENFDCTWQVYWDDANNPSRALNIDDIPWKQYISSAPGDPCIVYSEVEPRRLNCEKIRLAPLVDTPCVRLEKATDGGMLANGTYQAFIAYTENEQRVTDFIGISNMQSLWSHEGTDGSLDIHISNLDKDYEFFELALLIRNQGQVYAKRIGLYSTERKEINLDFIDDQLISVDLSLIPQRSPAYEKSEAMYVVNDWLIRQGPTEQFDFNYQPIANNITTSFVVNQISSQYYHLGGNKLGYMRDEQYAFFIRWIYNTGERSSSYHIPGRAPEFYAPAGENEDVNIFGANVLDPDGDPVFKVYNTGEVQTLVNEPQEDGSTIIARGKMGYWESTERYPSNRPDIWGDLCGKPIRHHKMPAEDAGGVGADNPLHISTTDGEFINIIGVEFGNIERPKYNDGTYITNVVGYELLRGARGGAKSILGKGLFRNMREYTVPNAENLIGDEVQGLYPNFPYNDLRPDVYFHDGEDAGALKRTGGCNNFAKSIEIFKPLTGFSKKVFTFSSPDLMFTKPFLNAYETRIYGDLLGQSSGSFKASEDHPQFKLLRNGAAVIAAFIGVGYAIGQVQGTKTDQISGASSNYNYNDWLTIATGGGSTAAVGANGIAYGLSGAAALAAQGVAIGTFEVIQNGVSLIDLYGGGAATDAAYFALGTTQQIAGVLPGNTGGNNTYSINKNTPLSNMPTIIRAFATVSTTGTNIAIGGNEILELIYNLVNKSDFVWKYNSLGFFNKFKKRNTGLWRIKNTDSNYIGQSFQTFDSGNYKINNLFRPSTVAVALDTEIETPSVIDTSRFVIGGDVNTSGTVNTYSDDYLTDPSRQQKRPISAYYGALKFNFDNQYGQLDGIKQIPMRSCVEYIDLDAPEELKYTSAPIFSGDIFITRYTEKVIMPIFAQFLYGQPDEFTYDYSSHVNIPYPRYWLNSQKFDLSKLAQGIATLSLSIFTYGGNSIDPILPNDLFYLDRGNDSCNPTSIVNVFSENDSDPNPVLAMRYAYMYSHSNGILDFFVESEINLSQRDYEDTKAKRIYSVYDYNDLTDLFHAQIQKIDNFYKYDESLSPSKFPSQLSTWGQMQTRFYDPYVAENCYVARPKRLIYSLQAQEESKKDYWRVFLNFNYKDFKNKVNVIKPINKNGAIVFFPYLSPQMFQGVDTLRLGSDNNITIGDGRLFSQPFQNIANSDLSNEYGSCESLRSVINTPMGLFYISQAQGKIFQYAGRALDPISNNGMKWWFEHYLPSLLIKQYPLLEQSVLSDNPIAGVGCQTIYDQNDDLVYFSKKDYRVKDQYVNLIEYSETLGFVLNPTTIPVPIILGDPFYFDNCSWTISYDPKSKAWISFHDWHPELCLPSINHFFTTKTITTTVPQCPPDYLFNSVTGLCELDTSTVVPNYNVGTLWRHNERCDSYANYYGVDYPWEVELVSTTGQQVNTLRSIEYQMEAYVYKGLMGNACGEDKWEDLNFNFDQSIIFNNEQVSGLLQLVPTPFNNPILELTYPIINTNNINILCSKVEQKYRFNQFWDITNDRGEFTNAEQPIWNTEYNGYIKNLNNINLNYLKSPLQHKKFRNYFTNVILRRTNSGNRKMLLRLNNTKLLTSLR
jgi:membrane associated rhomboid family serine protease|tara:strand:+ start:13011 stop:18140 length:5130 start_codon:yes stop_codon:yes gene_type:complete